MPIADAELKLENVVSDHLVKDWTYFLPTSSANQVIQHQYYTISYNEEAEQADWVAYELKKEYVKNNDFKRPYFIEDPKVDSKSADWRNYKNSGYDKGHLCPAGDMKFDLNAYNDTFYTSNISPQLHDFNAGIWNRLEQKVRFWAERYDGVIVITGGVLNKPLRTIGNEKVMVPNYFYKIVFENETGKHKMIAFLMPNIKSNKALYEYIVSVDSIEKMTGIDFFSNLEDKWEDTLEKNTDYKAWIF
ncbi:DNA/RNA non-specific endonuclease [Flavobacterium sp.]|uniref:DNA/RNA non-specific endonuclease n=1 Tax=Flavobacterium sp. TaxID=239 RepID=UPI003C6EECBC